MREKNIVEKAIERKEIDLLIQGRGRLIECNDIGNWVVKGLLWKELNSLNPEEI